MATEEPIINCAGEKVALGPLHPGIKPHLLRWSNDFVYSTVGGDDALPVADIEETYQRMVSSRHAFHFVIYELATMRPIGALNLRDINRRHLTAVLGIGIGERDCWSKGYGTEAMYLVLDFGFTSLGLENVMLDTVSFNTRAIAAYQRVGFREIGRQRGAHRVGQRVYDVVLMDCIASEFRSPLSPVIDLDALGK